MGMNKSFENQILAIHGFRRENRTIHKLACLYGTMDIYNELNDKKN